MQKNLLLLMAAMALMGVPQATAQPSGEARLLRFPSTNGTEVAFTYAGDLYRVPITGGTAERITSHNGYELFSHFSPDGKTIAFTAQYDGNTEAYVMPAQGGEPRRITFTGTNSRDDVADRMGPNNIVMAWTPGGDSVIYRNREGDGFVGRLYAAPLNGGMPRQLPLPEGGFCCYSPDGTKLAYNRVFREFRTWKYYKGGMADDIWIYDFKTKKVENVTNNVAQDIAPMWIGNEIYFISDRDKTMNLFVYNTTTKATQKVTQFTDYDVKFPSCGGGKIVFENGGYIYALDPATKHYSKISITLNSENTFARTEQKKVDKWLSSVSLSPNGNRIAAVARGDVFDLPVKEGVTRNITRTPGAHDRNAEYSPDGKSIAFLSDRSGEVELWLKAADDTASARQLTHGSTTYISDFEWSPDGKKLIYSDFSNSLVMVDAASGSKVTLMQDSAGRIPAPVFSPDGRWIAYTRTATNDNNVIYLYNLQQRKEYPVTESWYESNSPEFSADGKYLIFASGRDFSPIYSQVEWNFAYSKMEGIYLALLSSSTPSPFLLSDDKSTESPEAPSKDKKKGDKTDNVVNIDPDGITNRIVKVPVERGNYGDFYCANGKLYYDGNGGTHLYDLAQRSDQLIAPNASMSVSQDGKTALFFSRGNVYVTPLPQGKVNLTDKVNTGDMVATIDYAQEWAQIFNAAWRNYRDGFYLKNMHGVDWKHIHDKYAQLLPYVKNRIDLTYVIGAMISELGCGHAYVDGGAEITPARTQMGLLGARFEREGDAYRITKIFHGAPDRSSLRSPLEEPGLNVKVGDYITAIDGVSLSGIDNIYSLLTGKAGVLTELSVANSATGAGARNVVVKPIADEYPLEHYEWVMHNIKYVNDKTGGKVGYVYIPDMGPEGLNEFARYFFPQVDKEALIVDDRGNGGGNISPMIIERLLRQPYRLTMARTTNRIGTVPDKTLYGPKVLLVNKYSASDGDLFPWSFKATGIGKVIGTRTWGGIIGITSSLPYIDGTQITIPFFTNYDAKTGRWIVENHGVDPDIVIDNDPAAEFAGHDQQLDKAIEVILNELNDRKPLPGVPPARTLHDLGIGE